MRVFAGTDLDTRCLVAIPKKGRLNETLTPLLEKAGITYKRESRLDIAHVQGSVFSHVTLVFLPASDIATFVNSGSVDFGITGLDVASESQQMDNIDILSKLGFGKCRLSVCGPDKTSPKSLVGKRIATSFPVLTKQYFDKLDPTRAGQTQIFTISGSVEISCALGLADGII
jgi:ATP phosphoribosyltransferase